MDSKDERRPFVDKVVVEYLDKVFAIDRLMNSTKAMEANQAVGYMKGTQAVINRLKYLIQCQEETLSRN